jgi:hypothetical protein
MMTLEIIFPGHVKRIVAIRNKDRCETNEYLETLDEKIHIKLFAIMTNLAHIGQIKNKTKLRPLENGIWEFKANKARIFCFFYRNDVVCTHGADKPKRKRLRIEINKAAATMNQFLEERG